ncbi:hypothetical protein T492DRAFT_205766 [Pavlovales sp. CCMP2436]|nr:hypothetical protein T492DRAFT_205766 [Pavlovales sp. CCMP2436]
MHTHTHTLPPPSHPPPTHTLGEFGTRALAPHVAQGRVRRLSPRRGAEALCRRRARSPPRQRRRDAAGAPPRHRWRRALRAALHGRAAAQGEPERRVARGDALAAMAPHAEVGRRQGRAEAGSPVQIAHAASPGASSSVTRAARIVSSTVTSYY